MSRNVIFVKGLGEGPVGFPTEFAKTVGEIYQRKESARDKDGLIPFPTKFAQAVSDMYRQAEEIKQLEAARAIELQNSLRAEAIESKARMTRLFAEDSIR